ncbi:fatty acyl-CoA reductase wat-like [Drosophila busckii]|uniref:fatty acyl-CoA reductase wat-like n=1 Tax=Drosophila busckii TaxID=30019 RepID=UPI00083EA506|nr:fatty acyl-CoA reductase wat-like [Drosophila busckii]
MKLSFKCSSESQNDTSLIKRLYNGSYIFITGATGFLGKILLCKLLTSCPDIKNIYVLVRSKKNIDLHRRIDEILNDPIFKSAQNANPYYRRQVIAVGGDCQLPGLGICPADRKMLVEHVNIVYHMAATVRFDEKLKMALRINVISAYDVLQLCKEMRNLQSVVHVSTAYTHCPRKYIEEKFYPIPIDAGSLMLMAECIPENILEQITPIVLCKWPNTYTFTKAVAEEVIRCFGECLPIGVFRPGIVISTYREPVVGWIDNFYGPTGAIAGAGTGVLRTLHCKPKAIANMVPVDLCINSLIAASWDIQVKYQKIKTGSYSIPVYNFCTSEDNQLSWGDFTSRTTKYGLMYPSLKAIWYLCYSNTPSKVIHLLLVFFLHYIPALMGDIICIFSGRKPRLLHVYKKVHRFMNVIEYFSMREWRFETDNIKMIWNHMTSIDRDIFFFDLNCLDWELFLQQYYRGIRHYLLNDPLETIPKALDKWNRLYWMHQIAKSIICSFVFYILWILKNNLCKNI